LTLYADPCRAAVDHIELERRSPAHINDATTTIRTTIHDTHDHRLAVTYVRHQHPGAERQRPMRCCKPGRAGYFAACGNPAAIKCGNTVFSANRTARYRQQNNSQCDSERNHQPRTADDPLSSHGTAIGSSSGGLAAIRTSRRLTFFSCGLRICAEPGSHASVRPLSRVRMLTTETLSVERHGAGARNNFDVFDLQRRKERWIASLRSQ
jgi:hypothetical protein